MFDVNQWWANPNPDLDLNPDLTNFPNPAGFGLDLKIFEAVDLDLNFLYLDLIILKGADLDLDMGFFGRMNLDMDLDLKVCPNLDLNLAGFAHLWSILMYCL